MRTTATQVRALAGIAESQDVEPFIETANAFIDTLAAKTSVHDDRRLELIERHLAAHLAFLAGVATAASVTSKSIAGASTSYNRASLGTGLAGSPYGLAAKQLDTTAHLIGIMEGTVQVLWLGTPRAGHHRLPRRT